MNRRFGLWPAQIFIALMFALEHKLAGATWIDAFLGSGIGSLLFGMAAIATQGLAVPIGVHAAWNLGHWALGLKGTPGLWRVVVDPQHQQQGSGFAGIIIYDAVMLSAAFGFWDVASAIRKKNDSLRQLRAAPTGVESRACPGAPAFCCCP